MQASILHHPAATRTPARPAQRLVPVVRLTDGEPTAMVAESRLAFDDQARFDCGIWQAPQTRPDSWLASELEAVFRRAREPGNTPRPILVRAPLPALMHPNTPPACLDAMQRAGACPQEAVIEFDDWILAGEPIDVMRGLGGLRRSGFRVGIDARRHWKLPAAPALLTLLETIRVSAHALRRDASLPPRCQLAMRYGVNVIVDKPHWRDAGDLSGIGVRWATSPLADA